MSLSARPPAVATEPFVESLLASIPDLRVLRLKDLEQLTFCLLYLCDASKMRPVFQTIQHAITRLASFELVGVKKLKIYVHLCLGSGSAWNRINMANPDPDLHPHYR